MNRIGIIQGRLSPRRARLQSFPWNAWREEFARARALGFEAIEWVFEPEDYRHNPLWSDEGRSEIQARMRETHVAVPSVCADYFLYRPFFRVSARERRHSIGILNELVRRAATLHARVILIPVLEVAAIQAESEKVQLLESLREPLDLAQAHGMTLALESELPAREQLALVAEAQHPALGLYYDTGNATARGYDIAVEIHIVAPFLRGVHIKDRPRRGPNVPLGEGDANFEGFFPALQSIAYKGTLILQSTPGDDYFTNARRNLDFVQSFLAHAVV
jgi:L-ribulose-5-phosphate 3-epimerase